MACPSILHILVLSLSHFFLFLKMSTPQSEAYDFIIVGAGIAGTVLASRLHEKDLTLPILLIEAGPDPNKTPLATTVASGGPLLWGTELDWNYITVRQKNLDGRQIYAGAGKGISGGSIINYGSSRSFGI
jgi:choline dehydrogenase-like flavoprotein